ncbi:gliding motility-associated C-terminal domain-containing protein, partial [Algoriphagus namhaensis]
YSASYAATQADINAGTALVNTATVDTNETDEASDDATTTITQDLALALVKSVEPSNLEDDCVEAQDELTYTFVVTNQGNVTLTSVAINEDSFSGTGTFGVITFQSSSMNSAEGTLKPGESATYTATYIITTDDVEVGVITNQALAEGFNGQVRVEDLSGTSIDTDDNTTYELCQRGEIKVIKTSDFRNGEEENCLEAVADETVITYTFTVTNEGNVPLSNIEVIDNLPGLSDIAFDGGDANNNSILDLTETWTYSATYTVTQNDIENGLIQNNVEVSADDSSEDKVTDTDSLTIPICQEQGVQITKSVISNDDQLLGTVSFEIAVTNTGNVTLFDLYVEDQETGDNWMIDELAPGEEWTEIVNVTITQELIDGKCYENTAIVEVREYFSEDQSPSDVTSQNEEYIVLLRDSSTAEACFTQTPSIALVKTAEVESGDDCIDTGDLITYTFTATNTGNVTLTSVSVEEFSFSGSGVLSAINFVSSSLGSDEGTLLPGESATYTATYEITLVDTGNGLISNQAVASGLIGETEVEDLSGDTVDTDNETLVELCQIPSIDIVKEANVSSVDAAGEVVTYTLTVTNTGNLILNSVRVTDPLTEYDNLLGQLVPGQVVSLETSYTVTQTDMDNGDVLNVATATGSAANQQVSDSDNEVVTVNRDPSISLDKQVDLESVSRAGIVLNYTLAVTNTGNVTLSSGNLVDPKTGLSLPDITLAVGETKTFTTTYTVTIEDILSGAPILNIANVEAIDALSGTPVRARSEAVVNLILTPEIEIVKVADKQEVSAAGEVINYTLTVTNKGTAPLFNVVVEDPLTGLNQNIGLMLPNAVQVIESEYVTTQSDIDNGSIINVAKATGTFNQNEVSDQDDAIVEAIQSPSISIDKVADVAEVNLAGQVITYTLTVTNDGNTTLNSVQVTDPLTGYDNLFGQLVPGQVAILETTYTVTQEDIDSGEILNVATATGFSGETQVSDQDDARVEAEQSADIEIVITDNDAEITEEGEEINYTITVTNTGNVTLENVTIVDSQTGLVINVGTLKPGESKSVDTTYPVNQEDVDKGSVTNEATATGESPSAGDDDPTDTDEVTTPITQLPSLSINKTADVEVVGEEGEVITYTIVVTNDGNLTLTNIVVTDPLTGLEEIIDELVPGASVEFETSYTVTIADIAAQEPIVNVATVTAEDPRGEEEDIMAEDDEIVTIECIDDTLVTGIIFNPLTDQPLPNVPITLVPQGNTSGETLIVITDADGRYVFKDVVPGNYLIQVQDANLNAQGLFNFQKSSLAFRGVEVCAPVVEDFQYAPFDGIVLGDFVWYDLNQDGVQNEWFDANNDGQVTLNDLTAGPISISEWEWFDLNGDGRYDGPENEGELNKAGLAGNATPGQPGNIQVSGPLGFEENVIVGVLGYWRVRVGATEDDMFDDQGGALYGEYTAVITTDPVLTGSASRMEATGLVKNLPNNGGRMTDINGSRFEERCGFTTSETVSRTVSSENRVHFDMDFGKVCVQAEVQIIANDDDFGTRFISFGGLLGNILENDILDGVTDPDPDLVDFEFTDLDGVIGLLIDENGDLSLIPGVNEAREYTLRYTLRETAFPDNQDDAIVVFRLLNDQVDLGVTKTSFEAEIFEGDEFEYEIVITNGDTPATNVVVTDNLPTGVTYISNTVTENSTNAVVNDQVSGSAITWTIPALAPNASITIRVKVKAGEAGLITNTVVIGSDEDDTDESNNQADDVNNILPFHIPNVITPNNDGDNDTFEIQGLGKFASNEIVIINRFGDHVLEQEDYKNDWNAPGQVAGTYFYILKAVDSQGKLHEFKGWIQVIKGNN